jgi:hypothetical protein
MSIGHKDTPSGGKPLSIFIEDVPSQYNSNLTPGKCSDCKCNFTTDNDLEPLVHCIIKKSAALTRSRKNATFIYVPVYTNYLRSKGQKIPLSQIVVEDSFKRWKGARHVVTDALTTVNSNPDYMSFSDQHVVIAKNLTIDFIRQNRWMNSRHILVPTLQKGRKYRNTEKTTKILCLGSHPKMVEFAKEKGFELIQTFSEVNTEVLSKSQFTILYADKDFPPFLIYDIIRARSIPVLVSKPFLAAFANTHINYSRVSIRVEKLKDALGRIEKFDLDGVEDEIEKAARYLTWPLNGGTKPGSAAEVLLDFLNTRHRVLRPTMRRTFIGSDDFIP